MKRAFELGEGIRTAAGPTPYRRRFGDPVHRSLRVYTQDPTALRFDAADAIVKVPWEPLQPGPTGAIFAVRDTHQPSGRTFAPLDLDDLYIAMNQGLKPTTTEPQFAQQMTYAIAMATYERFQLALGRLPEFSPAIRVDGNSKLDICPHFDSDDNAYYDPDLRALCFGYVKASKQAVGRLQKGAYVFTSLSHDVIIHETTHALLDGMRPLLMLPSNPDVAAFHEGFADLVALLMRFRYKEVVKRALEDSNGALDAALLTQFAKEWGRTGGDGRAALRQVLLRKGGPDDTIEAADRYNPRKEHHDLGAVLVAAIFEAMSRIFDRKTRALRKIAAQAPGAQDSIIDMFADKASELAGQFLNIIIRAVDYCPPVDITFGEFLRAMITADAVTVPEDPHGYREALVLAFRRYGITVPDVDDLSEDSLLWKRPKQALPRIEALSFAKLEHGVEPGWFPSQQARETQAEALGDFVTQAGRHACFGLVDPATKRKGEKYDPPVVQSVRTLRRLTPDDELDFHVVAEVSQRCVRNGHAFFGGATIILDEEGEVRLVIGKGAGNLSRHGRTDAFLNGAPREYRAAFDDGRNAATSLIRRYHSRGAKKR